MSYTTSENFNAYARGLELVLAEAMGHETGRFYGTSDNGYLLVGENHDEQFPNYVRDRAATFALMCKYNCTPDRSSLSIPYNEGWAYVPGTKARVDLRDFATLEDAYAVVIVLAAIEKIRNNG